MKRYNRYKESGISWIGEIPEHWGVVSIKRITSFCPSRREELNKNTIVGYAPMERIRYGEMLPLSIKLEELSTGLTYFEEGDIIMAKVTPCFENRNIAIVPQMANYCGYGSSELFVYRNKEDKVITFYLFYFLQSSHFITKGVSTMTGTGGLKRVSAKFAKNAPLPLPPLSEQETIVAYLEEKVAQMDNLVAKQEAQIAYLRELKQAIIAKAVTQGIDPQAPLRPSGIPWIGDIPEHWEVKRLGRCFGENRSLNSDLGCTEAYKFNYGSLIRKDENINPQELVDTYIKYTLLRENDIVINGLNLNYDFVSQRVAIATQKGIITSAYLTLSPRKGINYNYYCLLFKAMDSMKLFHGMGSGIRLTLSYKDLKNQRLPLPPPSEQEAIVTYINRKTEEIDRLIAMTEQEIARVRELKQTLIADVVTGRINVQPS